MTEVFQQCQNNFYKNIRSAQKTLKQSVLSQQQIGDTSETLKEAAQELNKMQIEYTSNRNPQFKVKIDLFREQLRNYKKQLQAQQRKTKQSLEMASGPLFDNEQQNANNKLVEAKRLMYQNQAISNDIALGLKQNTDKLKGGINKIQNIDNQLTVAQKLLGSIKRKMRKNKLILWGTLAALMVVMCLILYSYVG